LWTIVLAASLSPTTGLAQTSELDDTGTTITGSVVLADDSTPVAGALVLSRSSVFSADVIAGADGRFTITNVPPGKHTLTAAKSGLVAADIDLINSETIVTIVAGQESAKIVLRLRRTGAIVGTISDPEGEPIRGLMVAAMPLGSTFDNFDKDERGRFWVTDDTGGFRIFGLAPGDYYIVAAWANDVADLLKILPRSSANQKRWYGTTFYPGTAFRSQARPVHVLGGSDTRIEFTAREVEPANITVQVDGEAVGKWTAGLSGGDVQSIEIEEGRVFEFQRTFPGEYELEISDTATRARYTSPLTVREGEPAKIVINPLASGGAIVSGNVSSAKSQPLPERARLTFTSLCTGETVAAAIDDEQEKFTARMPAGTYVVEFESEKHVVRIASVTANGRDVAPREVKLTTGQNLVNVELEDGVEGTRSISGRVRNREHGFTGNVAVVAVRKQSDPACKPNYSTAVTDQNGTFSLDGVMPGKYDVYAFRALPRARLLEPHAWLEPFRGATVSAEKPREYTVELQVIEERP
jgi:hypothetical protein